MSELRSCAVSSKKLVQLKQYFLMMFLVYKIGNTPSVGEQIIVSFGMMA